MIFTSSAWRDIEKYFDHTYVKLKEFGDKLFYIQHVSPHEVRGKTEDSDEFIIYLSDKYPYHVDYILPHKAVFQYKGRSLLLQRNPQRQYKRGLCEGNTLISDVITGEHFPLNFERLRAYVNKPSYLTLSLYKKKLGTMHSAAISPRFSVGGTILYVDDTTVGSVNWEKQHIHVAKVFLPEISQLISISGDAFTVSEL